MSERLDLNFEAPKIFLRKKRKKELLFHNLKDNSNIQTIKEKKKLFLREVKKKKEKKIQTAIIKEEINEEKNHVKKRLIKRESGNPNPEKLQPEEEYKLVAKHTKSEKGLVSLRNTEEKIDEEIESLSKWFNTAEEDQPENEQHEVSYDDEVNLDIVKLADGLSPEIELDNIEQAQEGAEIKQIEKDFETLRKKASVLETESSDVSKNEQNKDLDKIEQPGSSANKSDENIIQEAQEEKLADKLEIQEKIVDDDGELTSEWENFLKNNSNIIEESEDQNNSAINNKVQNQSEDDSEDKVEPELENNKNNELQEEDTIDTEENSNKQSEYKKVSEEREDFKPEPPDSVANKSSFSPEITRILSELNVQVEGQRNLILDLQREIKLLKDTKDKAEKPLTEGEKRQKRFQDKLQAGEKLGFFGGGSNVEIHDYTNPAKVKIEKIFDEKSTKSKFFKPFNLLKWLLVFIGLSSLVIILLIIYFCFTQEVQPDCGCIQIKELVEKIF